MLGQTVKTNRFGNEEMKIVDDKGGHVTIVKYPESIRLDSGVAGHVTSRTVCGVGGIENIRNLEDLDANIAGVRRINRLSDVKKEKLVAFLETFRIILS